MRNRTQLSRADLLVCLAAQGEDSLAALALALGYGLPAPKLVAEPSPPPPDLRGGEPLRGPSLPAVPTAAPKGIFYRVITNRELEPSEAVRETPEWFQDAEPLLQEGRVAVRKAPPLWQSLLPWSRLWPFLKTALGARWESQALDVPRVVDRLARGQTLRRLPRQQRQGWAARGQLIVDYAESLRPFWTDFNQLHKQLGELRGRQELSVIAFPDGDPGGRCWTYSEQGWREIDSYVAPAPGAPVLVLSDLGCSDSGDSRRQRWRRFGLRLQRADCRPVALLPCPGRLWDRELSRLFYPVCWDRTTRLPARLDARRWRPAPPAERSAPGAGAERLLTLLAPAIRIEPALLRAVRYLLPATEADVGSEVAVWNHPSVHATPLAFYYDAQAIEGYREQFRQQNETLRRQVLGLIAAHHADLSSPVIGYEERWLAADLEQAPIPADVQRFLERIVKTLYYPGGGFASAARAWVQRVRQRQHEAMWQYEVLAAAWVAAHLPQLRAGEKLMFPAGIDLGQISWLLGQGQAPGRYTLRQRGQALGLEADRQVASGEGFEALGSPLAAIDAQAPYIQYRWIERDRQPGAMETLAIDQAIPLAATGRLHLRTDHQELTIASLARPAWAEAIGRDEQGLFVVWESGQRRARWVNPGSYPVRNRSGVRLGQLTMADGYWRDEAEALAQQREGFPQPDWAESYGLDDYGLYADVRIQGVVQRLRWIAPGEFMMGSPENEAERSDSETLHPVILTPGFWLADTACTQALWQAVMGGNPSRFKGDDRPVENVIWDDVQRFIEKLNSLVPDGDFRLPTEAEWEYACRAGTTTPFWFGDQITPEQVNYYGDSPYAGAQKGLARGETVAVKALPCNSWGLYQMHGNVWEWCQDWYGDYPVDTIVDPTGPAEGQGRVLRGGSWINSGRNARSANRNHVDPAFRSGNDGFRLARGQAIRSTGAGGESKTAGRAAPDRRPRSGVGQVLRDLWDRITGS